MQGSSNSHGVEGYPRFQFVLQVPRGLEKPHSCTICLRLCNCKQCWLCIGFTVQPNVQLGIHPAWNLLLLLFTEFYLFRVWFRV